MSLFSKKNDLLDDAVAQVHDDPVDPRQVEEAAARVWARLQQEAAAGAPAAAESPAPVAGSLHGCEAFRTLIPAYVKGELAPARALLVEDHTRTCIPCRRALLEARGGKREARPAAAAQSPVKKAVWMSLAAALLLALGAGIFLVFQEMMAGGSQMARVESVEGTLYRVAGDRSEAVSAGTWLDEGQVV